MTRTVRSPSRKTGLCRMRSAGLAALTGLTWAALCLPAAATTLADLPISPGAGVPGNLALTLSVEYPTANSVANNSNPNSDGSYGYDDTLTYLGYFDPLKCYTYAYNSTTPGSSYFQPASFAGTPGHNCAGLWSGNFMNWATMQTIDPFRWVLSGGYRSVDQAGLTVIEKAWGSGEGGTANFPDRGTLGGGGNSVAASLIPTLTPLTASAWSNFYSRIEGNGNAMVFSSGSAYATAAASATDLSSLSTANTTAGATAAYRVYVRVKVCDPTTSMGTAGLEANCVQYGNYYKPQGLLQQYSNKIRYSAISYLNNDGHVRQGGVLRESMGFIGPTVPLPNSPLVTVNPRAEWDPSTGIMNTNPDPTLASASGVSQSGVMNYLNKFGEAAQSYMVDDNVSELYYAAIRYYENLGNVPEWTASASATELDGFPAAAVWTDPIAYSCQKNFILGIGDDHTHTDYNVGGGTATGSRVKPPLVAADGLNQADSWTSNLQVLEGITPTPWWEGDYATYYIAGLAYGAHTTNIRPDLTALLPQPATPVTVSTFWMDVEEYGYPEDLNPYYLATKYGGFQIPSAGYTMPAPLLQNSWDPSGITIQMNPQQTATRLQPANYYLAGNANAMVAGLNSAFTNISNGLGAFSTAFSLSTATIAGTTGTTSFSSQYNPSGWTGTVTANTLLFASDGTPSETVIWTSDVTLQAQAAGTGWDTGRRIVTWSGTAGVPFRYANLTSQASALTPSYSSATTPTQYISYLRGDSSNEIGSAVSPSTKSLRSRALKLGDVVNAKLTEVGVPSLNLSESTNPGYAAFIAAQVSRPTMVYAGANDGMLHGFVGSSGTEQFAYVPSATIQGPNGTPQVDGLAQLGNPSYIHHFYVDATPLAFDIDFNNSGGNPAGSPSWHSLLIGGMGKGGKSFYAIDVTNPGSMTTEAAVSGDVKWEFTDSNMGYSYGAPIVVKTAKYGWVVALTSGYNSSSTYGYLYLLNPVTGALLQKIATSSASSGLTQASAYVQDYTDYTSSSIYVGDLNGQLWRFDLTGTPTNYPAPTLLAVLTDGVGAAQPITSAPLIEIHPGTRKRYVMFGTGQLLSNLDLTSVGTQTFYAILDGSAGNFAAVTTPITRAMLTQQTNVTAAITLPPTSKGWYYDLIPPTSLAGSRLILSPVAYNGIVAFATLQPSLDPCSAATSQIYALNYATGLTTLQTGQVSLPSDYKLATNQAYVADSTAVTDLKFAYVNGQAEIVAGDSKGQLAKVFAQLATPTKTRLLNWREIPTAD